MFFREEKEEKAKSQESAKNAQTTARVMHQATSNVTWNISGEGKITGRTNVGARRKKGPKDFGKRRGEIWRDGIVGIRLIVRLIVSRHVPPRRIEVLSPRKRNTPARKFSGDVKLARETGEGGSLAFSMINDWTVIN